MGVFHPAIVMREHELTQDMIDPQVWMTAILRRQKYTHVKRAKWSEVTGKKPRPHESFPR